jgi:predicted phage terminase large subunit-like protein
MRIDRAAIDATLREIERLECEESFSTFIQHAWRNIDPAPYLHNWHIELIAEYAEGIVTGQVRRLLVNQPPRTMKSIMLSVCFPAWIWAQRKLGPRSGPQVKFMFASYGQELSFDLSTLCRKLILSPWYQELWGDRFRLSDDRNRVSFFENDKGGYRIATSVGATVTGRGADIIGVDDPHNTKQVESDAERQTTINWWTQSLSTRLNDPKTGAFFVVMQRQHDEDLSGYIIGKEMGLGWHHVCVPMRFETDRTLMTEDPRQFEGELLWPERFGEVEVVSLEAALGPYGTAGQLQQSPQPKGGGIIKREWWKPWTGRAYPSMSYVFAAMDTAYTSKQENDPSALTVWGVWHDEEGAPRVMLMHAWQGHLEFPELVKMTVEQCRRFKVSRLLVEGKASGLSLSQEIRRHYRLEDWTVQITDPGAQDKVARAHSVVHLFFEGLVYAPFVEDAAKNLWPRQWAGMVIDQATSFPKGSHDDLVDTAVTALTHLRDTGILLRRVEFQADLDEVARYRKPAEALYPV